MAEELENEYLRIEEDIVAALRTVYDPEIPVNVYDLGLIYCVELTDEMFRHHHDDPYGTQPVPPPTSSSRMCV